MEKREQQNPPEMNRPTTTAGSSTASQTESEISSQTTTSEVEQKAAELKEKAQSKKTTRAKRKMTAAERKEKKAAYMREYRAKDKAKGTAQELKAAVADVKKKGGETPPEVKKAAAQVAGTQPSLKVDESLIDTTCQLAFALAALGLKRPEIMLTPEERKDLVPAASTCIDVCFPDVLDPKTLAITNLSLVMINIGANKVQAVKAAKAAESEENALVEPPAPAPEESAKKPGVLTIG